MNRGTGPRAQIFVAVTVILGVPSCGEGWGPLDEGAQPGSSGSVVQGALEATPATPPPPRDEDFVPVPGGGRYHRSCGKQIPLGARVDRDGKVFLDGREIARRTPCLYAPMRGGERQSPGTSPPLPGNWVEDYYGWAVGPRFTYNRLHADWTVPPQPQVAGSQLLYLFPALTAQFGTAGILQPVLQWGVSPAGGGQYWAIAGWWVWQDGTYFYSQLATVYPGDSLRGDIVGSYCNDYGVCEWEVRVWDFSRGIFIISNTFFDPEAIYKVAYPGALEVYNVTQCGHYPNGSSGVTQFMSVGAYEPTATDPNAYMWVTSLVNWQPQIWPVTPSCGFALGTSGNNNFLLYY